MKKKTVALLLACVMALGVAIGGTMAWLTDSAGEVKNTFTVGDINIELKEHEYDPATESLENTLTETGNNDYLFVPGDTLPKDPFVTVKANSEECYLFVKVQEKNNVIPGSNPVNKIIDWTVVPTELDAAQADVTWTKYGDDVVTDNNITQYWYCKVSKADADQSWYILNENQITVDTAVTKDSVTAINSAKPELVFAAAAVQSENLPTATAPQTEVDVAFGLVSWP